MDTVKPHNQESEAVGKTTGRPRKVSDRQIISAARRCFLDRGAAVSAAEIAQELGVSHTTLFNRFGSKEGLMLAALGPSGDLCWVGDLEAGPDPDRPFREQLVEHAMAMSAYFSDLQAGHGVLQAAGIDPSRAAHTSDCDTVAPAVQAYRALVGWLERAQDQGQIAPCDLSALASTMLGALHGWAFTARVCGESTSDAAGEQFVRSFIDLLWTGIGVGGDEVRAS